MPDTEPVSLHELAGDDAAVPVPPRDGSALVITLLTESAAALGGRTPESPDIFINGDQVQCDFGRWFLPVAPGNVTVEVVTATETQVAFTVTAPPGKIRRLNIRLRPQDDEIPLAVHCPYPPSAGPGSCLVKAVAIVLLALVLINVLGRLL